MSRVSNRLGNCTQKILSKYVLLKQGTDLHTSMLPQVLIDLYFREYNYMDQVKQNIDLYRDRLDTMLNSIQTYFLRNTVFPT